MMCALGLASRPSLFIAPITTFTEAINQIDPPASDRARPLQITLQGVAQVMPATQRARTCASTARLSVATRSRVLSSSSAFSLASVFLRFRMYACTQSCHSCQGA